MLAVQRRRHVLTGLGGFTLIEMLTVIAIIMLVMALALPNFVAMMRSQRWSAAVGVIQGLVWRARAIASSQRVDISVEFDIRGDDGEGGTTAWLESEQQLVERIPNLEELQHVLSGGEGFVTGGETIAWLVDIWRESGGEARLENGWYTDFRMDSANSRSEKFGDNARQSEEVSLPHRMTVDPSRSTDFFNWDDPNWVMWKGMGGCDNTRDIRIGPRGSLVQSRSPVICIRSVESKECRRVEVVRCTGRLVRAD